MAYVIVRNKATEIFHDNWKMDPKTKTASNINGQDDSKEISDTFADKFDQLYNSVPLVAEKMEETNDFIQTNCQHCEDTDDFVITEDISEAIKYLKSGKSDGDKGLVSNHFLMSCEEVNVQLWKLITAINTHGYQPRDVLMRIIVTILKD